jgi:hypothetical protein
MEPIVGIVDIASIRAFLKDPIGGLEESDDPSHGIDGRGIGIRPLRLSARGVMRFPS